MPSRVRIRLVSKNTEYTGSVVLATLNKWRNRAISEGLWPGEGVNRLPRPRWKEAIALWRKLNKYRARYLKSWELKIVRERRGLRAQKQRKVATPATTRDAVAPVFEPPPQWAAPAPDPDAPVRFRFHVGYDQNRIGW